MRLLAFLLVFTLSSCTRFYAGMISYKVTSDQLSLQSYAGTYTERYTTNRPGEPEQRIRVVKKVTFEAPSSYRVEVLEPAERAGELVVYDGHTMSMFFPTEGVGVRIEGADPPTSEDIRHILTDDILWSWQHYATSYRGRALLLDRPTGHWRSTPKERGELLFPYETWTDLETSLPLRMEIADGPGHSWYDMTFEGLDVNVPVPEGSFRVDFPVDATLLDWDLGSPDVPEAELREALDFELLVPTDLPEGLGVHRMIGNADGLPAAVLLMNQGGRWLSLTEVNALGRAMEPGSGIPILVGPEEGYLNLMGTFSSVSWYAGGTALSLVGNLPWPEMVKVAASILPPPTGEPHDVLALDGYRGRLVETCPSCPQTRVVKEIRYQAPGQLDVEVLEPPERAGERFVYDGKTVSMYWPDLQLGMRIEGAEAPTVAQLRAMWREDGAWGLRHYSSRWGGQTQQAGREASLWRAEPRVQGLRAQEAVLDRATGIPCRRRSEPTHPAAVK